jgi:hypothetical protein
VLGASRFAGFGFIRTFDHIAVGITLTLATVAATTLATGATTWTIAFGAFLTFFQLLFVAWQLFFGYSGSGLLGTWLTFFTRWAWSTFFTWLAGRALFSGSSDSCGVGRSGVQWLTQFTYTFFTLATWLAIFTRGARCTLFTWSAWSAFFAGYCWSLFTGFAWLTLFAWFSWRAFFTRGTFFARLAFFIAATVTGAALLTTVATLFVAGRTFGSGFFNHGRSAGSSLVANRLTSDFTRPLNRLGSGTATGAATGAARLRSEPERWRGPGQS